MIGSSLNKTPQRLSNCRVIASILERVSIVLNSHSYMRRQKDCNSTSHCQRIQAEWHNGTQSQALTVSAGYRKELVMEDTSWEAQNSHRSRQIVSLHDLTTVQMSQSQPNNQLIPPIKWVKPIGSIRLKKTHRRENVKKSYSTTLIRHFMVGQEWRRRCKRCRS